MQRQQTKKVAIVFGKRYLILPFISVIFFGLTGCNPKPHSEKQGKLSTGYDGCEKQVDLAKIKIVIVLRR